MTDWLRYEWEWDNQEAVFQVDLQYWELLSTLGYSHLVYVSCAPRDAQSTEFSRKESRATTALQHKLCTQLEDDAIFVGGIGLKNLVQFYFYTSNETLIQRVSAVCRSESALQVTCGHASDSKYATYYCLLFPDDAKLQSVENASFIRTMQRRNGDLTLVRQVRLLMAFPTEDACDRFINTAPHAGFSVGLRESVGSTTHPYRVTILSYATLQLRDLNRCTARAIRAALPFDGVLDHIDADFIPRH